MSTVLDRPLAEREGRVSRLDPRQMEWWWKPGIDPHPDLCVSCNRRRARRGEVLCGACTIK